MAVVAIFTPTWPRRVADFRESAGHRSSPAGHAVRFLVFRNCRGPDAGLLLLFIETGHGRGTGREAGRPRLAGLFAAPARPAAWCPSRCSPSSPC